MPVPANAPTLVERLKPTHLDPDDLKDQIKEKSGTVDKAVDDPKGLETYTFQFRWVDGRGQIWEGEFTNKILSIGERQQAGVLRAMLGRGVGPGQLDEFTNEINMIMGHLTYSLAEKKPDWAKDLTALQNPRLLQAIYEEVASHEATFFGLNQTTGGSKA
jgi:hypothetical protein